MNRLARKNNKLFYKNTYKIVKKIIGPARNSKEIIIKEIIILNNRKEIVVIA